MTRLSLAIIIVSYNAREDLERCLMSLTQHAPATPHEVVVTDNASTDGTAEAVRSKFPAVSLRESGANLGFAVATNAAIRETDSDLILMLNGDSITPPGAIDALVDVLRTHDDVSVVGPRLVDGTGKVELSTGSMIGPVAELRQKVVGSLHRRGFAPASFWVRRRTRREHYPDWVSGACLLVRRPDAEAAGLLDERYFLYNEDVDFCAAIRRRGGRVLFTPDVEVVHLRGRSVATAGPKVARAYRQSQLAFYRKHRPRWVPVLRLYLWLTGRRTA